MDAALTSEEYEEGEGDAGTSGILTLDGEAWKNWENTTYNSLLDINGVTDLFSQESTDQYNDRKQILYGTAEIASLTERVPSHIRCSELLEACAAAQAEINSVDFLSYGQKVDQGLQNLLDHNQYITEHFVRNMETHTEKMRGLGKKFKRLTDTITYSGEGVQLKRIAFSAVSNTEAENTDGEDENASVHRTEDMLRGGAEEAMEVSAEEVMAQVRYINNLKFGENTLKNYMVYYEIGNNKEITDFINCIAERRPDLLVELYIVDSKSSGDVWNVYEKIFREIAIIQNEPGNSNAYMEIYDNYKMNMAIEILEEYLAHSEEAELCDPNNWTKIEEILQRNNPRLLINLYEVQGEEGKAGVFAYLIHEYEQSVEYIFDHISEVDVSTKDDMYALPTPDLLARMIYQEYQNPKNGEQNKVLWATINRYFSKDNFTNSKESTIRNILLEGGYESIDKITTHPYDGYHPDYDSEG